MRETIIGIHYEMEPRAPDFVFPLTLDFEQEGTLWVGTCLELGTSTFAESLDALRQELQDAVVLQLNEVENLGFIDEYLEENRVHVTRLSDAELPHEDRFYIAVA